MKLCINRNWGGWVVKHHLFYSCTRSPNSWESVWEFFLLNPFLSLQSQLVILATFHSLTSITPISFNIMSFFSENLSLTLFKNSVAVSYPFSPWAGWGKDRRILFPSWFGLVPPMVTILMDQIFCRLHYNGKSVIWKFSESEIEESMLELKLNTPFWVQLKVQYNH
jgi:hypothetical protein